MPAIQRCKNEQRRCSYGRDRVGRRYAQLFVHKITGNATYLHRALQFQRYVADRADLHDPDLMRVVTPSPWLFYVGSFESAIMYWADFVAFADHPEDASMPLFEAPI